MLVQTHDGYNGLVTRSLRRDVAPVTVFIRIDLCATG
jgi:hypothetical protein